MEGIDILFIPLLLQASGDRHTRPAACSSPVVTVVEAHSGSFSSERARIRSGRLLGSGVWGVEAIALLECLILGRSDLIPNPHEDEPCDAIGRHHGGNTSWNR